MLSIQIKNQEKFNQVKDVDFSQCSNTVNKNSFDGYLTIELEGGDYWSQGQHHVSDFEEDFGFKVVQK